MDDEPQSAMRVCTGCIDRAKDKRDDFCGTLGRGRPHADERATPALDAASAEQRNRDVVQRHYAALGEEPNLLCYIVRDREDSASQFRADALHIPPNTVDGVPIETDCFKGAAICMYRPTSQARAQESPHSRYFQERRRAWEFRVQGQFKRAPTGEMYIGIVLRDFNYNQAVERSSRWVKKAGMSLVKYDMYMSWGDRCKDAEKPDAELTHLVTTMQAWDQIIVTPAGQQPPLIKSELHKLPPDGEHGRNFLRKTMGVSEFSEAVGDMLQDLDLSATYTMCFWGVSQVIDLLNWNFKFPIGNIAMARFFEESPLHICMYELELKDKAQDDRHLESRKKYYLDVMLWSNLVECPELPKKYVFRDAPLDLEVFSARACGSSWSTAPRAPDGQEGNEWSSASSRNALRRTPSADRGRMAMLLAALRWIPASACASAANARRRRQPAASSG